MLWRYLTVVRLLDRANPLGEEFVYVAPPLPRTREPSQGIVGYLAAVRLGAV